MVTVHTSLKELLGTWRSATQPEEVFGSFDPITESNLKRRYRELVNLSHPDRHPASQADANEAFKLLQGWYQSARNKVTQGCYGVAPSLDIQVGSRRYLSRGAPGRGDLADLYRSYADEREVLLKVVRDPRNNDLMEAEARHLRQLDIILKGQPLRAHFPTLIESFRLRDGGGIQREVNVLKWEQGYFTLADVMRAFPRGIESADMVWMFNRVLAALAVSHSEGIVHGALVPGNIMIRPRDHNGKLIDWCYSVRAGEAIRAVSPPYRSYYPSEVLNKEGATPATDLFMTATCMVALLGGDVRTGQFPAAVPKAIQALLRGCLLPSPSRRAADAWELFETLHDINRRLYGRPTFRPFIMPSTL